jgi:hypothetical protein
MSEHDGVTLCSIRWSEVFPWLGTLRSFRLAVPLRVLALGAAGLLLMLLGWSVIGGIFSGSEQAGELWKSQFGTASAWGVIDQAVPTEHAPPVWSSPATVGQPALPGWWHFGDDPFTGTWLQLSRPVWQIFAGVYEPGRPVQPVSLAALLCWVLSALWGLAVWAFFGGAISRIAAVQLACDEQVGWGASLRWAASKWLSYFGAPLFPLAGVVLAVLPLLVAGWIMRLDVGLLLAGLLWPLALVGGLVMALLLLGLIFGWPLMWATISVEGTDTFDALSRAYAYVFQRPLRYLLYAVLAAVLGLLGWLLVENFAAAVIWLGLWGAGWGAGALREEAIRSGDLSGMGGGGVALVGFWAGLVKWLAVGYFYGYFWTASTLIYYLLRRDVDGTEMDEVFLEADQSEKQFNLPPLATETAAAPPAAETAAPGASPETPAKPQAAMSGDGPESPAKPPAAG